MLHLQTQACAHAQYANPKNGYPMVSFTAKMKFYLITITYKEIPVSTPERCKTDKFRVTGNNSSLRSLFRCLLYRFNMKNYTFINSFTVQFKDSFKWP